MTSEAQATANQTNAQSGGVKTDEGKAVSKYNATKHGILRKTITEYEEEDYSLTVQQLENLYKPANVVEEMLIERVAIYYLKLSRVQKAETEFMKSQLHPRITQDENAVALKAYFKVTIIEPGYSPVLNQETVKQLMEVYGRYEGNLENRLFRALHELERLQARRAGEKVQPPITADINQLGSFGENTSKS